MKILIVPDSFKESMSASVVAETIKKGFLKSFPNASYDLIPMTDGGEGFINSMITKFHLELKDVKVLDPLRREIKAQIAIDKKNKRAFIEMSSASGLDLLKEAEKNPFWTSTYGTGQLIKHVLEYDVNEIVMGIGGSATNDCGAGAASALGIKFFDSQDNPVQPNGRNLKAIKSMDDSEVDKRLAKVKFKVICDVTNPLLGKNGATHIFGPQKGARPEDMEMLENNMKLFSGVIQSHYDVKTCQLAGSGAAGGLGMGMVTFFKAKLVKGIDEIIDLFDIENKIKDADLIISGEGRIDSQTINGKVISGIAKLTKQHNKQLIVFCGAYSQDADKLYDIGVSSYFSIVNSIITLEEALKNGQQNLESTSINVSKIVKLKN